MLRFLVIVINITLMKTLMKTVGINVSFVNLYFLVFNYVVFVLVNAE